MKNPLSGDWLPINIGYNHKQELKNIIHPDPVP
jgi:hypothetical protein